MCYILQGTKVVNKFFFNFVKTVYRLHNITKKINTCYGFIHMIFMFLPDFKGFFMKKLLID